MIGQVWKSIATSLRAKLLISFVMVALVPLTILVLYNDTITRRALTESANQALFAAASQTVARLDASIGSELTVISVESHLPALASYLRLPGDKSSSPDAQRRALETLQSLTNRNPAFISSYALLDLSGHNIADTDANGIGQDESAKDYFQVALESGKAYVSSIEFEADSEIAYLYYSHLVFDSVTEKPLGVLRARYTASVLQQLLEQDKGLIGPQSYPLLLDSEGVILADGLSSPGSPSGSLYQMAKTPGLADSLQLVNTSSPYFNVYRSTVADAAAVAQMKTRPWLVVFLKPQARLLEPTQALTQNTAILAGIVVLIVAILAVVVTRLLTSPIKHLVDMADHITRGDLNIRADVNSKDEIGLLATAFNTMTEKLQSSTAELEQHNALLQQSEEKFRTLVQKIQAAVIIHGADTQVLISNSMAQQLLGLSDEQMLGKKAIDPAWHFIREDGSTLPLDEYPVNWVLKSQRALRNITLGIHRPHQQEHIWVLVNAEPVFDSEGVIEQVIVSFIDITERKLTEERLTVSEARFRLTLEAAQIGVWDWDVKQDLFYPSPIYYRMLGYEAREGQGDRQEWLERIHPEDVPMVQKNIQQILSRNSDNYTYEARMLHADGSYRWQRVIGFAIEHDKEGKLSRMLGLRIDIDEQKRATEELRQYKDDLEEKIQQRTADLVLARNAAEAANHAKSVFLANMSHELRTPLNAILGFSSIMSKDPLLPSSEHQNIEIINRSGTHLLNLINDVLEMAKIESGRLQLENRPFDLRAMLQDTTDMMEIRALNNGLKLLIEQSSEFPRFIVGDEARLRQIVINLLSNAIKFTRQGNVTLRLGTRQNKIAHLLIEVEDSGIGMTPEQQQHVFEPFVQLGELAVNKGTGLGLTITRQFVQMMGGNISVQSEFGKGSLFRVDVPLLEAPENGINKPQIHHKGEVLGLAPGQSEFRILIVEDNRDNQLLLTRLLEPVGFKVRTAEDGKQGVQLFQNWKPHFIWMDQRMPVMDGMQATRRIRELPGGKAVKIVAVTASVFPQQRNEMLDAGMDDHVSKPYRASEVYDCLSKHLGVKYIYEDEPELKQQDETLTGNMLEELSEELRNEFINALELLDRSRIEAVVQQIAMQNPALEKTLNRLVENYNYPAILKLLK